MIRQYSNRSPGSRTSKNTAVVVRSLTAGGGLFELLHSKQKPADVQHRIYDQDGLHCRNNLIVNDKEDGITYVKDKHCQRREKLHCVNAPEPEV